ncbi:MAG: Mth938-like domain-containing protein [Thiohalorhabdus sp.]|uniref:Mth938-like domain-containing protein n=1 Tax=Thiohalorhabdus sp. TaxID=3094134 RepID=UPI003980CEC9
MAVDDYAFGRITIGGRVYTKDVLLLSDGVHSPWWRKEGHSLDPGDLEGLWANPPEVLVIGTGYYGNMDVPEKTLKALRDQGIEPRVARTTQAVEELNRLMGSSARIAAALHLTC